MKNGSQQSKDVSLLFFGDANDRHGLSRPLEYLHIAYSANVSAIALIHVVIFQG